MAEEEVKKLTTEEKVFKRIVALKKQTINGEIKWNYIDLENPINENQLRFIEDLEPNEHINESVNEVYKADSVDKIYFVGKLITSKLDENDSIVRELDYFITISDMSRSVITTYKDSILQASFRKIDQFNYVKAISGVLTGEKNVYSSEIYRLIREIKAQILEI